MLSGGFLKHSTAIGQIRGLVQQTIQTQAIGIQRIWGEFTRQLSELLFNIVRHTHIKDALHQRFDGKQVSIDIF